MPNWCSNTVYITGSATDAAALRALMTTSRSKFDFWAILPMPREIEQSESSSKAETAWQLKYGDWHDATHKYGPQHYPSREAAMQAAREADEWRPMVMATRDNPFPSIPARSFDDLADAVQELTIKYGHPDWHSWACANWGTKWSATDAGWMSAARAAKRDAHQVAYFGTAWSPAVPVVMALSERFPEVILRLTYDEPDMSFRGFVAAQAGEELASKHEVYDFYAEAVSLSHNLRECCRYRPLVYIGPGRGADGNGPAFDPSPWANPFASSNRTNREAVDLYLRWLLGQHDVLSLVPAGSHQRPSVDDIRAQLRGVTLLCDCHGGDDGCHGRVLMDFACGWDGDEENCDDDERDADGPASSDCVITPDCGVGE
jgi:hypothetical protein